MGIDATEWCERRLIDCFIIYLDNLDATEIPEQTNVKRVAHLLGVAVQSLIDALTRRTIFAHGETVV